MKTLVDNLIMPLLCIGCIVFGILTGISFLRYLGDEIAYSNNSATIQATVSGCDMKALDRFTQTPELTFSYQVNGENYQNRFQVPRSSINCADFPNGMTLKGQVINGQPDLSRITDEVTVPDHWTQSPFFRQLWATIIAFVFILGAVRYLLVEWRKPNTLFPSRTP